MQYIYDDLGNVTDKYMGMYGETMTYDGLGRMLSHMVTHDIGAATTTFEYDTKNLQGPDGFSSGEYTWGQLVKDRVEYADDVSVERRFCFDWRGLPEKKMDVFTHGTGGNEVSEFFVTEYNRYDRAGNLLQMTYPSGQMVEYEYYNGGSLAGFSAAGQTIIDGLKYEAGGSAKFMTLHGIENETVNWVQTLNARKWPEKIMVGPGVQEYNAASSQLFGLLYPDNEYERNGNIQRVERYRRTAPDDPWPEHATFQYQYDKLNRLKEFKFINLDEDIENRYDYAMDEFGNLENRTGTNNNGVVFETRDLTADPSTNRLEGKVYDNLGNLKQTTNEDGFDSILIYMDQGHVAQVVDPDSGNVLYRYYYDAGGQRRIKARGESSDGIMDNASFSFYAGNELICQLDRGEEVQDDKAYQSKFLLLDHLGTTRAELKFVEDEDTGVVTPTIATGYDYMPYGELITEDHLIESLPGNPDPRTEQILFTGKPRDAESGLDIFPPRNFSSELARWMSPDQPFADNTVTDPQSWNLYHYVGNDPINYFDPDGREGIVVSGQPGDHKNREHFLVNGLNRAKKLTSKFAQEGNGEKVTWFIYNDGGKGGFSLNDLNKYQELAEKSGINVQIVSDGDDIVDYVNGKNGGDSRSNDLVTNIFYLGHSTPGDLDIGFVDHGMWNMMTNEALDIGDFSENAFSSNSYANLVGGCRTAVDGNLLFERSAAEQMADKVGGIVHASDVRVYYTGGVVSDKNLVGRNNGRIVKIKGRGGKKQ